MESARLQRLDGASTTLEALRANTPLVVVDFWNTRCTKCPAALAKLDALAAAHPHVTFVACALSLGSSTQGTLAHVAELTEGLYEHLVHVYADYNTKEAIKRALRFDTLPFAAAYDSHGRVCFTGDPSSPELHALVRA